MKADDLYRMLGRILSSKIGWLDLNAIDDAAIRCLVNLAEGEGVAPLVYWKIHNHQVSTGSSLPDAIMIRLRDSYYQTLSQNLLIYKELKRLLSAFEDACIQVIVFKGAALAASLYEDLGLRPMGDIDLLVHKEDLYKIFPLMAKLGYTLDSSKLRFFLMSGVLYEANFDGGPTKTNHVELHWNLIGGMYSRFQPIINWFWDNSICVGMDLIKARILKPESHFLYLAAHLALKHGMAESILVWKHDLYLMMDKYRTSIDWNEILQQAHLFQWEYSVQVVVNEVCKIFDLDVPLEVDSLIKDEKHFLDYPLVSSKMQIRTHLQSALDELRMVNWIGKCVWMIDFLFPRYAYLKLIYPNKNWNHRFFYLLYYWIWILKDIYNTIIHSKRTVGMA